MRKRIFISIELPDGVIQKLVESLEKWRWLPIRWLPPENWHITIVPPFYAEENEIAVIKEVLIKATRSFKPFEIAFDSIILAPLERKARMIWFSGPQSRELEMLKLEIERVFSKNKFIPTFKSEENMISAHITLARFDEGSLSELEQKTRTLEKLKLLFTVSAVDIMESHLKQSGAEYEMFAKISFVEEEARGYEFLP
ncbi:MAG: RNA 2',3'-cyclic phosphodiesterase [bacterium]|nr:RNA 2',3'-cyclic phosphodiesterase [bacterium]